MQGGPAATEDVIDLEEEGEGKGGKGEKEEKEEVPEEGIALEEGGEIAQHFVRVLKPHQALGPPSLDSFHRLAFARSPLFRELGVGHSRKEEGREG